MTGSSNNTVITAQNLGFQYPDGTKALQAISFEIARGESVAVVGGNGAGKSTLLLQFNGSLLPASGLLEVSGVVVKKANLQLLRKKVGLVFQYPDDQLFMNQVIEDVAFGPRNMGWNSDKVMLQSRRALEEVGLWHLQGKAPYHLSGGEKKRIAIATVLVMEPEILVFDEPSANVDPLGRRQLIQLLSSMPQTKIIATHDLDLALDLCERTILLKDGKMVADGRTEAILRSRDLLESSRLELPLSLQGG